MPGSKQLGSGLSQELAALQASKAPSKDLSGREVTAAERFSEHLLFLQRRQRAFLSSLGHAHVRLSALADLLSAFAEAEHIPDQVRLSSFNESYSDT